MTPETKADHIAAWGIQDPERHPVRDLAWRMKEIALHPPATRDVRPWFPFLMVMSFLLLPRAPRQTLRLLGWTFLCHIIDMPLSLYDAVFNPEGGVEGGRQ